MWFFVVTVKLPGLGWIGVDVGVGVGVGVTGGVGIVCEGVTVILWDGVNVM